MVKHILTAAYNYMVYNHLCGCYRPNNSRQVRCTLRTNCAIQVFKLRMYSAKKEVHMLLIVRISRNTFLCVPAESASYDGKCCGYDTSV